MISGNNHISVVMSVYNGHKFLDETIESIITQTLSDFEFIIIDDGSTDGAGDIIQSYLQQDQRINLIQNDTNLGLALSLNKGIQAASGKYIARMDADDISMPERLEIQIEYLENNPDIWILGSSIIHIDDGNPIREINYPSDPNRLRWNMLFGTTGLVCHPCAMMRTDKIREAGLYKNLKTSQDMDLWCRFFEHEPLPISNLQIPLVKCRWHENSFSTKYGSLQHQISSQIRLATINRAFSTDYDLGMVEAYRTENPQEIEYPKQITKKYISNWLEILKNYQTMFKLTDEEVKEYYQQIMYRMRNYASLNPLVLFESTRVWLPELLPVIGARDCYNLFRYKVKRW